MIHKGLVKSVPLHEAGGPVFFYMLDDSRTHGIDLELCGKRQYTSHCECYVRIVAPKIH